MPSDNQKDEQSRLTRSAGGNRAYQVIKDLGPLFTLLTSILTLTAIILTNWQSSRTYRINQSTSKAELYCRDIWFIPHPENPFAEIGVTVVNGGQRSAHVIRNRMEAIVAPLTLVFPQISEGNTDLSDEVVDRERPLNFVAPLHTQLAPGARTPNELHQALKSRGQQLFFIMKTLYSDGVDSYWMDYCKRLDEGGRWRTCGPR